MKQQCMNVCVFVLFIILGLSSMYTVINKLDAKLCISAHNILITLLYYIIYNLKLWLYLVCNQMCECCVFFLMYKY